MEGDTPTAGKKSEFGVLGTNFLQALQERHGDLSRSDKKLADLILKKPESVTQMNLAAFSQAAEVSQPTAIRFCRKLGCDGFHDFKIRVAQAIAKGAPYVHREIKQDDTLPALTSKIFASSIDTLQMVGQQLDLAVIGSAVECIAAARRIELLATGLSSVAAIDAHQKFMRLGVPTIWHADGHLQRMSVSTLGPGDVAIAFSYTGEIRDVLRTCEMALERGASLIGLTRSGSTLADVATHSIAIDTLENTFVYAPMTTRLAHLAVVDVLATAVALKSGADGADNIRRVKLAMRDEWLVEPDSNRDDSPR